MSIRRLRLGILAWLLILQFYIVQFAVAAAWPHPFSLSQNFISDLGNTVSSPLHALMNSSFVLLGVTIIAGAYLLQPLFSKAQLGLLVMALGGGCGSILVGLFPENSIHILHGIGAILSFSLGNLSLILLGATFRPLPRAITLGFGVVGLVAAGLYSQGMYIGLGVGGMERITAYPLSLWLIGTACYLLVHPAVLEKASQT